MSIPSRDRKERNIETGMKESAYSELSVANLIFSNRHMEAPISKQRYLNALRVIVLHNFLLSPVSLMNKLSTWFNLRETPFIQ